MFGGGISINMPRRWRVGMIGTRSEERVLVLGTTSGSPPQTALPLARSFGKLRFAAWAGAVNGIRAASAEHLFCNNFRSVATGCSEPAAFGWVAAMLDHQ
jgi:hypothetical protein